MARGCASDRTPRALIRGRHYVVPEDLYALAEDVLLHRMRLTYEALADGQTAPGVLHDIVTALGAAPEAATGLTVAVTGPTRTFGSGLIPLLEDDERIAIADMPRKQVRMVLYSAFQDPRASVFLGDKAGVPALKLPFTVGGTERAQDLFGLFDDTVDRLLEALNQRTG